MWKRGNELTVSLIILNFKIKKKRVENKTAWEEACGQLRTYKRYIVFPLNIFHKVAGFVSLESSIQLMLMYLLRNLDGIVFKENIKHVVTLKK